jgi:hypothetical protein
MNPIKVGQIAKFREPYPDEQGQLYVVLEVKEGSEPAKNDTRIDILALNTGLNLPSIGTYPADDLVEAEVSTDDLLGYMVNIVKPDGSCITGRVKNISEERLLLELNKTDRGIITNVWLTVIVNDGQEHKGVLYIPRI